MANRAFIVNFEPIIEATIVEKMFAGEPPCELISFKLIPTNRTIQNLPRDFHLGQTAQALVSELSLHPVLVGQNVVFQGVHDCFQLVHFLLTNDFVLPAQIQMGEQFSNI